MLEYYELRTLPRRLIRLIGIFRFPSRCWQTQEDYHAVRTKRQKSGKRDRHLQQA